VPPTSWLLLRVLLPFPLSGATLVGAALLASGEPRVSAAWAHLCATGGMVLGLAALFGLWISRERRARRLTLWAAALAVALVGSAYVLAADPFCWRGNPVGGVCAWE
jgi:hypothetical protein